MGTDIIVRGLVILRGTDPPVFLRPIRVFHLRNISISQCSFTISYNEQWLMLYHFFYVAYRSYFE